MRKVVGSASLALLLIWGALGGVKAENVKKRWHIGGGSSFFSTQDDIRSNAAFVEFQNPGSDGIPDSGDETVLFFDPRPDDTLSRETTIEETFKLDFNVSYGITDWFSLQLDTGYFKGDLVQMDTFVNLREPANIDNDFLVDLDEIRVFFQNQPFAAGEITEIPISLSGIFRFRRDSPLNPYLGVGLGYIFTDIEPSARFNELADTIAGANILLISRDNTVIAGGAGLPPFQGIKLELEDSTEFHLLGGAEYFFNSNLAVYFDARYTFAREDVRINVNGFDQLTFTLEALADTLPFCNDLGPLPRPGQDLGPGEANLTTPVTSRPNGFDFDMDGMVEPADFQADPNFGFLLQPASQGVDGVCRWATNTRLRDNILVQGGRIALTSFEVGVGLRWYF